MSASRYGHGPDRGSGPPFGRHGHGGDRPGSSRRRMFDSGELRLVLLLLMQQQPRHGYDLIREIESRTGGAYTPSPGIIYPTLTLLEELGQIEAAVAPEGSKRLFNLTPAGEALLEENRAAAEAVLARLEALGAETDQLETGPVWRALANLKAVLQQRLTAAQDKQAVFDAVDLIDEAAKKIERL